MDLNPLILFTYFQREDYFRLDFYIQKKMWEEILIRITLCERL